MAWVKDIDSLYDFLGYVVLRAPNRFPVEDYLPADEQMTLDKAFSEIRTGLSFIDPEVAGAEKRKTLLDLLDASYLAYQRGDDIKGAHLLQDLEGLIFKS